MKKGIWLLIVGFLTILMVADSAWAQTPAPLKAGDKCDAAGQCVWSAQCVTLGRVPPEPGIGLARVYAGSCRPWPGETSTIQSPTEQGFVLLVTPVANQVVPLGAAAVPECPETKESFPFGAVIVSLLIGTTIGAGATIFVIGKFRQ